MLIKVKLLILLSGHEIILSLLDTWVSNQKSTDFQGKVKDFGNTQNLNFKDKSRKIIQQNVFNVMIFNEI